MEEKIVPLPLSNEEEMSNDEKPQVIRRGRGRGGRSAGARTTTAFIADIPITISPPALDFEYEFELFTLDNNGNLRTPELDEAIPITFTFSGAIENFRGRFDDSNLVGNFGFEVINVTDRFARKEDDPRGFGDDSVTGNELPTSFFPLTLDLIARYLPEGSTITLPDGTAAIDVDDAGSSLEVVGADRIEYVLSNNEVLENLGINELTLILKDDLKNENGFQLVVDEKGFRVSDINPEKEGFQVHEVDENGSLVTDENGLFVEQTIDIADDANDRSDINIFNIDIEDAIGNIEYIIDNVLLGLYEDVRVSGVSSSDFNQIVSIEFNRNVPHERGLHNFSLFVPLIIEAEDLNLTNYLIENYTEGDEGDRLVSLENAPITDPITGQVTGQISLEAGDYIGSPDPDLYITPSGYDLTISYFDESDGNATIEVLVNGITQGDPLILNENPEDLGMDNRFPNEAIRREFTIRLDALGANDMITIQGTSSMGEGAAIDYIIFEPIPFEL